MEFNDNERSKYILPPRYQRLLNAANLNAPDNELVMEGEEESTFIPWERRYSIGTFQAIIDTVKSFLFPQRYLQEVQYFSPSEGFKYWLIGVFAIIVRSIVLLFIIYTLIQRVLIVQGADVKGVKLLLPLSCLLPIFLIGGVIGIGFAWGMVMILSWISWLVLSIFGVNAEYQQVLSTYYYIQGSSRIVKLLPWIISDLGLVILLDATSKSFYKMIGTIYYFTLIGIDVVVFVFSLLFFMHVMKRFYDANKIFSGIAYVISLIISALIGLSLKFLGSVFRRF